MKQVYAVLFCYMAGNTPKQRIIGSFSVVDDQIVNVEGEIKDSIHRHDQLSDVMRKFSEPYFIIKNIENV